MLHQVPLLPARYTPLGPLGHGAQGTVWRCFDRVLGHEVAVKVLPAGDPPDEFGLLRALQHPGIVEVHDLGRQDGRGWFSMELVQGEPWARPGRMPEAVGAWARRTARLLEAVGFLHDRGLVHGDIKPSNVILRRGRGDHLVLIDFGLATVPSGRDRRVRGTPGWIAPEVLGGTGVSVASDLYAVGVMAATALAGQAPFFAHAASPGFRDAEALARFDLPPAAAAFRRWIASLLQADPGARPRSAREALAELEAAAGAALANPTEVLSRIAPVVPLGHERLAAALTADVAQPGLTALVGPRGSGRATALERLYEDRRSRGQPAIRVRLDRKAEVVLRNLAEVLAPVGGLPPVEREAAGGADLEQQGLFVTRLSRAVQRLLATPGPPLLILGLHRETSVAGALLDGLRSKPPLRSVVVTATPSSFAGVEWARVREMPRLGPEQTAGWIRSSLGSVVDVDALAKHLDPAEEGLPGQIKGRLERLLSGGALRPGEGGWHWTEADVRDVLVGSSEQPRTADWAERTVADALGELDAGEALAARRALQEVARDPDVARGEPGVHRRALEGWAKAAGRLGEYDEAAAAWARLREEHPTREPAARRARLLSLVEALEAGARHEDALRTLDDDVAALHGAPMEAWGRAAAVRGSALLKLGRYDEARSAVDRVRRSVSSSALRVKLEVTAINADWQQGAVEQAEAACRALLATLGDDASNRSVAVVQTTLATCLRLQGRMVEAAALLETAAARLHEGGFLLEAAKLANNLGIVQYQRGDWLGAIEGFDRFRALTRRLRNDLESANADNNLGCLYRDTGQIERAKAAFQSGLAIARAEGLVRLEATLVGNLAEGEGLTDRAAGESLFADCLSLCERFGIHDEAVEAWRRIAQMRIDAGDPAGASTALEAGRAAAGRHASPLEEQLLDGLDAVLRVAAEPGPAAADAEAVIAALVAGGSALEAARLRLRLAEALQASGDGVRVVELLDAAEAVFRPLPARPELQRVAALRARATAAAREDLEDVAGHLGAMRRLALDLAAEVDLDVLLGRMLDNALALVEQERGFVVLLDENGVARVRAARPERVQELDVVDAPSRSAIGRVLARGEPVVALDLGDDVSLGAARSVVVAGIRSIVAVPIRRSGRTLGLIYVDGTSAIGGDGARTLELLTGCADAASVAIENAQLFEALTRRNEALKILAHELRTPIHAIRSYGEVLRSEDGPVDEAERHELVGTVIGLAERADAMIGEVLDLARMEAGKVRWRREEVDPLLLMVKAKETVLPLAERADVALELGTEGDPPEIRGDGDRLVQVLVNLLSNAVKFSPAGGVVALCVAPLGDDGLLFTVEDEGQGLPPERLTEVFDAYAQADAGRGGVGLGLAISKRIVSEHGGTIRATNRDVGGARFEVELPASGTAPSLLGD